MNGYLDEHATSAEVGRRMPRFAVLPVGSHEQHGAHLPLASDSIAARAYGQKLAEDLGGLLLPTLPYGTSYEHLGFPGTISLRWRTLGAIVEDIVRGCWRQGIGLVFVYSGHGGNFVLNPCVRDLNARSAPERPDGCRVVLIPETLPGAAGAPGDGGELHAGRGETSVLSALVPDLVRPELAVDGTPDAQRAELTNRPLRELSPSGVWGRATLASAEEGVRLFTRRAEQLRRYAQAWLDTLDPDQPEDPEDPEDTDEPDDPEE